MVLAQPATPTTISSIKDWSKVASVHTCTIGQGPLSVKLVLRRKAQVYLLVIRHRPVVADIHKALWEAHLYCSPKQGSCGQLLIKHDLKAALWAEVRV